MSAERSIYLDSSAIVKLAIAEPESVPLRRYLRRRRATIVTSALARTEVARALLPLGSAAVQRGNDVLRRFEMIRVSDRLLTRAGAMQPTELRSLDAIHLATVQQLGASLTRVVTYDERMATAAAVMGYAAVGPS